MHDDGSEGTYGAGDAYAIAPGHDAWVVGDEEAIAFEFHGAWANKPSITDKCGCLAQGELSSLFRLAVAQEFGLTKGVCIPPAVFLDLL